MNIKKYCIIGIFFTVLLGTLLHFTYDLSGNSDFVAILSAVNESTWEHLKLIFFPMIVFMLIEFFIYGKSYPNFFAGKLAGIISGMAFITVVFYTYNGIIGTSGGIFNILLFIAGVIFGHIVYCKILTREYLTSPVLNKLSVFALGALLVVFWVFTFYPPLLNIFKDPVTGGYGI